MDKTPNDYIIRISCGPDYEQSKYTQISVNNEHNPGLIDGPNFVGFVGVRVLNYSGLAAPPNTAPIENPASDYFKGRHRRYSLVLQGRFKHEINGDDIIFGIDSDTPVRMPTGIGVAIKIAKWLDPAVEADLSAAKPYLFSPLLCAMNSLGVFTVDSPEVNDTDDQSGKSIVDVMNRPTIINVIPVPSMNIGKWSFHSRLVPENVSLLVNDGRYANSDSPSDGSSGWFQSKKKDGKPVELGSYEKRKKYFAELKRRSNVTLSPDHVYCMDFYDAYFDMNTISLKLPGVSISAFKYWDEQPLRFSARSKSDPSIIYFVIVFEFLDRSELGLERGEMQCKQPSMDLLKNTMGKDERCDVDASSVHDVPIEILTKVDTEDDEFKDAEEGTD